MKNLKALWDRSPEMMDEVGGEQLADSGFENEPADEEFVAQVRPEEE